jgi:hypothetical protein
LKQFPQFHVTHLRQFFLDPVCIAVLPERVQYRRCKTPPTTHHSDPVSVEHATGKLIKVRSKVTLRFAGAWARNTAIVVSVAIAYRKLRAARLVIVRTKTSQVQIPETQPPTPTFASSRGLTRPENFIATPSSKPRAQKLYAVWCARRSNNVVDLVNRLEIETRNGRQDRIAEHLTRMDFIVLDELGYLPFAQSGGQLLFHLVNRLYESTSIVVATHLAFGE